MTMGHRPERRVLLASRWLYQHLLPLYPAPFRERFGPEMVQVFTASCRDVLGSRGLAGLLPLWVAAVYDLMTSALGEHLRTGGIAMTRRMVVRLCGAITLVCAVETAFDRIDTTYFGSFWWYIDYHLASISYLEIAIPLAMLIAGCGGLCALLVPRLGEWSWPLVLAFIGAVGGGASRWWLMYEAQFNTAFFFSLGSRVAVILDAGNLLMTAALLLSVAISAWRRLPARWVTLLAALGVASLLLIVIPDWIGSFLLSPPVPLLVADTIRIYVPEPIGNSQVLDGSQLVLVTGFYAVWALLGVWLWRAVGRVGHLDGATAVQLGWAE